MKRLFFIVALLSSINVFSQITDTLFFGMDKRNPTYFYDCWADEHMSKVNIGTYSDVNYYPRICAKPVYTNKPLTVIGVAAAVDIKVFNFSVPADTLAEYFQIYEATETSFERVAEVRYDTIIPTKYIELEHDDPYVRDGEQVYAPLFEAYFKTPVTVYDSFYVAYTSWNNEQRLQPNMFGDSIWMSYPPVTIEYLTDIMWPFDSSYLFCRTNLKLRFLPIEGDFYSTIYYQNESMDTTKWYNEPIDFYIPVFPIFDTTLYSDTCADVSNLSIISTDSVSAILSWDSTNRNVAWQLAYGIEGTTPNNATVIDVTSTVHRLENLNPAQWYVAYVRALCDGGEYTNWTDSVRFYIAGDTTQINIPYTILEEYTHIIPNPATDKVNIFSSFSIRKIEIYSLKGVKVKEEVVSNTSSTIDVSNLSEGIYLVKVYTPSGVATKKLVIN